VSEAPKGDKPRKGDLVRVTYEGVYAPTPHGPLLLTDGCPKRSIFDDARVEVLERADDPAKDKLGTLRREAHDDALVIYMKTAVDANGWWTAVYSNAAGIIGKRFDNQFVAEFTIFDSCPGTPAAEAEKPDPNSHDAHRTDLAEALRTSDALPWEELLFTARRYATHAIRDEQAEAREYPDVSGAGVPFPPLKDAPPLPEVPPFKLGDWVRNRNTGAVIQVTGDLADWLPKYYQLTDPPEPRVFSSDGPEPPTDILCLEWSAFGWSTPSRELHGYAVRHDGGWTWARGPGAADPAETPSAWPVARRGEFREVLPS
jgi:hypothetical protein